MICIHDLCGRKQLLQHLKKYKTSDEVIAYTKRTSWDRVYYADVLSQWLKCQKLSFNQKATTDMDLIATYIFDNIILILKEAPSYCTDVMHSLSNCCWGLLHYLKVYQYSHLTKPTMRDVVQDLLTYTKQVHISQDHLILIQPLIIWTLKIESHIEIFKLFDSDDHYNISNFLCCFIKSKLNHEKQDVESLLKYSLKVLQTITTISNHFSYFSIIERCLAQLVSSESSSIDKNLIYDVFILTSCYTDGRGSKVSTVCLKIQELSIILSPGLEEKVRLLAKCPWYSRQRYIYTNILIDNGILACDPVKFFSDTIKCLGYNRLDHTINKTLKKFLCKYLNSATFKPFVEEYLHSVSVKPTIVRILAEYIGPMLLQKQDCFPRDLDFYIEELYSKVKGLSLVLLLCLFEDTMQHSLKCKLINSVSSIGDSESQALVTKLICRQQRPMEEYKLHFEHVLSMNCPTVRQHAICGLKTILQHAKNNNYKVDILSDLFLQFLTIDSPYHQCILSLNFFNLLLQKYPSSASSDVLLALKDRLQELIDRSDDADVVSFARLCSVECATNCTETNKDHSRSSAENVEDLLKTVSTIDDVTSLSNSNVAALMSALPDLALEMSDDQILCVADTILKLLEKFLGMISEEIEGYSAPSFEESFLIVSRSLGRDEQLTKVTAELIWASISNLLKFFGKSFRQLMNSSMNSYMSHKPHKESADAVEEMGMACLKCIFRCRHRSVINAASETLRVISEAAILFPTTCHLPRKYLSLIMNIFYVDKGSSLSRRSAGLPEAIESILQCQVHDLTLEAMRELIDVANTPYRNMSENHDCVQVHALHMMRKILSSSKLRTSLLPFSTQICELCYEGFGHSWWIVRNASLLLFSELVNFILGHKITIMECGYRSNISVEELRHQHRGVYQIMVQNLQDRCKTAKEMTHPSVYLSLTLLSVIYPVFPDDDREYRESLWHLLTSQLGKVRAITARLITVSCCLQTQSMFLHNALNCLKSVSSQNGANGILLFLTELYKTNPEIVIGECHSLNASLPFESLAPPNQCLALTSVFERCITNERLSDVLETWKPGIFPPQMLVEKVMLVFFKRRAYTNLVNLIKRYGFAPQSLVNCLETTGFCSEFIDILESQQGLIQSLCNQALRQTGNSFIFSLLNSHDLITNPNSRLMDRIVEHLKRIRSNDIGYMIILVILSTTYGYDFAGVENIRMFLQRGISFKLKFTKAYETLLSIRSVAYVSDLSVDLAVVALIQCQSEDESLQLKAIKFCQRLPCSLEVCLDIPSTPLYAMVLVVKHLKSCNDNSANALKGLKELILRSDTKLSITNNSHFSRTLILNFLSEY